MYKQLSFLALFFILTSIIYSQETKKDVHYFIQKAYEHSSTIKQAEYEIKKYKNMELEAISVYTPKVSGLTWIAPMYSINKTDDPWQTEIDYNNWAPYYHLDLLFQQPICAFTRVISGIRAAREGQNVARADVEITKWNVAKEVRLYYYGIVFGRTLLKTIDMADEMLSNSITQAKKMMAEGSTEISEVDLNKLEYHYTQIPINRSFAEKSVKIAEEALFLVSGERLEDEDLPNRLELELSDLEDLPYYTDLMFENRPLFKKLNHGILATKHLMQLEYKSMIPVLFAGGYIKYSIAPSVSYHENKFLNTNYNTFGSDGSAPDFGIAFGFAVDFDPLKAVARALQKKAELDKLKELHNYALDGFPLQLQKTLEDLEDLKTKATILKGAVKNAQSWMFFAANAYAFGTGEVKEILEGLAAFIKAKLDYYQAIYDYNKMLGELCEIVGVDVTLLEAEELNAE